jgi:hypothetical protein
MGRIKDMKCIYCGKEHNHRTGWELRLYHWYGYGLSKAGTHCKYIICPDCLAQHFKREIHSREFYAKWHMRQEAKQGVLRFIDDAEQR